MQRILLLLLWNAFLLLVVVKELEGQSCGPRVSARLLAEIPCDMSKSSYCSAPGSAYPWSSVKRYINDNQGLVRRMYGDEKHSSVLLNEIDGFRLRFEMLRNAYEGFHSRTVYGRSVKSGPRSGKSNRRQPRPQIFEDEPEIIELNGPDPSEPATIFRVVTETSIKVGEAVTQSMTSQGSTVSYEPAAEFETTTKNKEGVAATTTEKVDETTTVTRTQTTTETLPISETVTEPITTETSTTATEPSTTEAQAEPLPSAMERIGYVEFEEEYEFEPKRRTDQSVLQNSVEEKTRYKDDIDTKKPNANTFDSAQKYDEDLLAEASVEEEKQEENTTTEAEEKEEVPRRGINACPVKNEVIAPYWANNTRGETLALLNVHPFEQYVHFEKCAFENHQMLCRDGCRCEQQYRLHRLLAFDPKNECRGIFSDWFRFPSCCVCICYDLTPDIPRTRRRKGRM
ncbi:protein spaetzle 4 [Parasteatoda tepidariorum]|uniref:protein spaetzle 4 n=1 Tax=Parasteatoda tepidariorum TaxID=114398 RepID=UPI00077FB75B|nr:protein spaetzle 4 [Parasteatoda tepidariorum]